MIPWGYEWGICPIRAPIGKTSNYRSHRFELSIKKRVNEEDGYDIRWIRIDSQEIPLNPSGHINVQVYAGG